MIRLAKEDASAGSAVLELVPPTPVGGASLAFPRMPHAAVRGGMAEGDRGIARRAKTGLPHHSYATADGFSGVPLGFAIDAPRGSAGGFTLCRIPESRPCPYS
jgi:hypothetical protein